MKRYKLKIAYDGSAYAGWQVQKTGLAIQPLIQRALETVLRHPLNLTGSGRTDAGVHALGQTAHFDTPISFEIGRLQTSLNALLPSDIRILELIETARDFHARYSAKSKIYHYHLTLNGVQSPFTRLYRTHVIGPFDLKKVDRAIPHFLGAHDFSSFANEPAKGVASRDPIRYLARLDCIEEPEGIRFEFEADGFLYKMVRNITGTLLDVGAGRIDSEQIPRILLAKDRRQAGSAAPAQGLFLMQVLY